MTKNQKEHLLNEITYYEELASSSTHKEVKERCKKEIKRNLILLGAGIDTDFYVLEEEMDKLIKKYKEEENKEAKEAMMDKINVLYKEIEAVLINELRGFGSELDRLYEKVCGK